MQSLGMRNQPDVLISVIIPVLNEEEKLGSAIGSAWNAGAHQVIVVDGGSSDRSAEIALENTALVFSSRPSRGLQLGRGVAEATGDIIVMLHADSRLESNAFESLRALPQSRVWGCFNQTIENPGRIYRWIERGNRLRVRWLHLAYGDQAIWVRKKDLMSVGGIAEIPLMEDVELSRKLSRIGRPCQLSARTFTSSRRWEAEGVVRRTIKNWFLLFQFIVLNRPPEILLSGYQPNRK